MRGRTALALSFLLAPSNFSCSAAACSSSTRSDRCRTCGREGRGVCRGAARERQGGRPPPIEPGEAGRRADTKPPGRHVRVEGARSRRAGRRGGNAPAREPPAEILDAGRHDRGSKDIFIASWSSLKLLSQPLTEFLDTDWAGGG